MKKEKKEKQKVIKKRKLEEKNKLNNRIYNIITKEEILKMRDFNKATFQKKHLSKQEMIEYLRMIYDIILRSSYIDKIKEMFVQNVSDVWLEQSNDDFKEVEINCETVKNILHKEIERMENSSEESLALKTCYWTNRIAHNIEEDVVGKKKRYEMNSLYVKYFLNPKCKYKFEDLLNYKEGKKNQNFVAWIDEILYKERESLDYSKSREEVIDLLLGIYLRNELFTTKAQMLKELIGFISKSKNADVVLTYVPEKNDMVSIEGNSTIRVIAREKNAIAPIVMHTNEANLEGNLVAEETDEEIVKFAQKGKIGIHFVMSEEELFALEYLADTKVEAKKLFNIMLRGEEDGGAR